MNTDNPKEDKPHSRYLPQVISDTKPLKTELLMRSYLSGLPEDGQLIEMMNLITPKSISTQPTTFLEAKLCKSNCTELIFLIFCDRLQNSLVWKLAKLPFSGLAWENDNHAGFRNVKTSENGLFLYKSS